MKRCEFCKMLTGGIVGFFTGRHFTRVRPFVCESCFWKRAEAYQNSPARGAAGRYQIALVEVADAAEAWLKNWRQLSYYTYPEIEAVDRTLRALREIEAQSRQTRI